MSTRKAHDLRKFLSRHTKSTSIDAHTLGGCRRPIRPGCLPFRCLTARRPRSWTGGCGAVDRRGRPAQAPADRAGPAGHAHYRSGARPGALCRADLVVLERYGDPRRLARAPRNRLVGLIACASRNHADSAAKADGFRQGPRDALDLYGDDPATNFDALADEITSEVRTLRCRSTNVTGVPQPVRPPPSRSIPASRPRSLPGIATVGAPMLVAVMGDPGRFPSAAAFKSYLGLAPKASETGATDRKRQRDVQVRQPDG